MSQKAALVIDDSKSIRYAMRKLLEAHGYAVAMAETAEAGIEHLKTERPDVIFLDHLLPGISGFEVLRKIKADARTVTIPVVICSSQDGQDFVTMVRSRGAVDVLHKPPNAELIAKVLEQQERVSAALRGVAPKPAPAPEPPPAPPAAEAGPTTAQLATQIEELKAQITELEAELTAVEDARAAASPETDPEKLRQLIRDIVNQLIRDTVKSSLAGTREELRQEARAAAAEEAQAVAQKVVASAGARIVEQVKAQLQKAKS